MRYTLVLIFVLAIGGSAWSQTRTKYFGPEMKMPKEPDFDRPAMLTLAFSPKDQFHRAHLDMERQAGDSGCIWLMLSSETLTFEQLATEVGRSEEHTSEL